MKQLTLQNCQGHGNTEEPSQIRRHYSNMTISAMWHPGLDPGTEKGH